jgi:hypothetical protein
MLSLALALPPLPVSNEERKRSIVSLIFDNGTAPAQKRKMKCVDDSKGA